jgi:nitrile hydratase accessory protein
MAEKPGLAPLASRDGQPAFAEPWQAEVLALAFALTEQGVFSAAEWSEALGAELRRAEAAGAPEDTYYAAALTALEQLTGAAGISEDTLAARVEAWRQAYLRTPHGQPVVLAAAADIRGRDKPSERRPMPPP